MNKHKPWLVEIGMEGHAYRRNADDSYESMSSDEVQRRVNAHDAMLASLKWTKLRLLDQMASLVKKGELKELDYWLGIGNELEAAIALAEGRGK